MALGPIDLDHFPQNEMFNPFSLHLPGVERKRDNTGFGSQPPSKRTRIGSPAEAVGGTSLEVDPVDLVYNVLNALDTHNSDKLVSLGGIQKLAVFKNH